MEAKDLIHWRDNDTTAFEQAFNKLKAFDPKALALVIEQARDYELSCQADIDAGEDL